MARLLAKGMLRGVIFTTADCDALHERVREAWLPRSSRSR